MSYGVIIPVIDKQLFDFSYLTSTSDTYETVLQNALNMTPYSSVILMVRLHEIDASSGAQVKVILRDVDPSPEDGADFVSTTDFLTVTSASGDTAPKLYKSSVGSNPGPYLRVVVEGNGPTSAGKVAFELSANLVCRAGT